ncbi:MAG: ATP synthase F1 subunit epsilon [Clostridia bacterium]|nr:ATP synthase F1 subunit epsilon [Clostridia bacterium]
MNTFYLEILSAERPFFEGECESLTIPTPDGLYGILANHVNAVYAVSPGELTYREPDGENVIAFSSYGIAKVENNRVLVLVETVELPEEIDEIRALQAAHDAKEALLQKQSIISFKVAESQLARSLSRIKVKKDGML